VPARGRSARLLFFFELETASAPCHLGWIRELFADRIPAGLLAIGTTECADKLCLAQFTGAVVLWELETGLAMTLAPSFEAFVATLYGDAQSPTRTSGMWRLGPPPDRK
jgi:hypothetical protein